MVYNAENMTETDFVEMESTVRETIGDNNMPTMAQIFTVKAKAESILEFLEGRFGEVPQTIKDTVIKITDIAVLQRLTVLAAKCKSLAEFKKALK